MNPRGYQEACLSAIATGWAEASRQLVVLPTGGGKTCIFAWEAQRRQPGRTLILAHREELIEQACAKLHATTGIFAQIEKAESRASLQAPVVVASVQTMQGARLKRWPVDHFDLVVIDEAHHALADSWRCTLSHFDDYADVLGVTATPDRGDKRNLGAYFERVAYEITLVDLIRQRYLSPITIRAVPLRIDLSQVKQTAGDYDAQALGDALDPYLDSIAEALRTHAHGRRTLAFLPLIATSQKFTEACRRAGLRAEHVDGYDGDRRDKLRRFAEWDFDVLSNAMLLTEGYDDPGIDCLLVLRPTRSRALYAQMIGRGTRIEPLKDDLLILDCLWMHERHSLCRPAHLVAASEEEADAITELSEDLSGEMNGAGQMDLLQAVSDAAAKREEKLRAELERKSKRGAKYISAAEFALRHNDLAVAEYEPSLPWERNDPTPKQVTALKYAGIDAATVSGRGHASKLLDIHFRNQAITLASPKQQALLRRMGHSSPDSATVTEFRKWMGIRR